MSFTQRGLLLILILIVLGIVSEWLPWAEAGLLWRVLAIAVLVVVARDAWGARNCGIAATAPARIMLPLGRERPVALALTTTGPRGVALELRPQLPAAVVADDSIRRVELAPGEPADMRWTCRAVRLGDHQWPTMPARTRGPLGLTWWQRDVVLGATVRVVPDTTLSEARLLGARALGVRVRPVAGSGSEILQLRPYRQGDARRNIDWKATARCGRMIARDFTTEQHREIIIAIDVGRTSAVEFEGISRLGHFANLASRIITIAVRDDDLVGLIAFGSSPVAVHAPRRHASVRLHNTLAGLTPQVEESNPIAAMLRLATMARQRALVLLLTDLDDAAATGQLAEAARLVLPKHFLVVADIWSPEVGAMADAAARTWVDPYVSLAAQEYQAAVRRNCAALTRLGCRTILAPPVSAGTVLTRAYGELKLSRRI